MVPEEVCGAAHDGESEAPEGPRGRGKGFREELSHEGVPVTP